MANERNIRNRICHEFISGHNPSRPASLRAREASKKGEQQRRKQEAEEEEEERAQQSKKAWKKEQEKLRRSLKEDSTVSDVDAKEVFHPGGNPGANLKSISHRCYLFEVAFVWGLTKETIDLPLGCLQGGRRNQSARCWARRLSSPAGLG